MKRDGRFYFNRYPNYPDCDCGRSSRWYEGITRESYWHDPNLDENFSAKKFTCIFCLSHTEEGSLEAIAIYGYTGNYHTFIEVISA